MDIINLKKIGPIVALSIIGCLIAFAISKEHYFLLMLMLFPVFFLGIIALVLERPYATVKPINIVKLPHRIINKTINRLSLTLIMGIVSLNIIASANPTVIERILASIIIILGFIPTFIYIKNNETGIPFLPLWGAIYSVYYGLPIFLLANYNVGSLSITQGSVEKVLLLAAIGLIILYLAYYKIPGRSIGRHLPRLSIYWDTQKATLWSILFVILGLGIDYFALIVNVPIRFQQPVLFLTKLTIIGTGILFILQLQGRLNKSGKGLLWFIFVPSIFMLKLGTGAIAQVLIIIIFLSLTYWTFRRKIPWKAGIVGFIVLIVLISARTEFRKVTWNDGYHANKSPIEKSLLFAEMVASSNESPLLGFKIATIRLAHILSFAHVVNQTPEIVPFWNGETYLTLLWTPIPRIIYPSKPTKELGQEFGHRYSLLPPYDITTSYNLPQLVEMYANFGITGVTIGMFILGFIYRTLHEIFCHIKAGEGGILIGIVLFTNLLNIESDFSLVFGGLFYNTILLIVISLLIKRSSKLRKIV